MRIKKPKGLSDAIARLRREEGWNAEKRRASLYKNNAQLAE